jgi:hypothetical protein
VKAVARGAVFRVEQARGEELASNQSKGFGMRSKLSRHILCLVAAASLTLLAFPPEASAQTRLYLKDGSYQLVKSYEIQGDRVKYYSLERSAWEEVPRAIVDFAATERAQHEEKLKDQEELKEVRALEKEHFERPEAKGFEIAPGVRLPQDEGVYAYDGLRVVRMIQSTGEVVTDKKRTALLLALPGPLLKNRAYVVLPGPKAAIRLMAMQPTFYVQSSGGLGSQLALVSVKPHKDSRQVEQVEWRAGLTKPAELRAAIPLERTELAPGLFKLTPTKPLELGEYALGELVQAKLNLELWDFGIEGTPVTREAGDESPPTIRHGSVSPEN